MDKKRKLYKLPRGRAFKNPNALAKEITTSKWRTRVVPKKKPREDETKDIAEQLQDE